VLYASEYFSRLSNISKLTILAAPRVQYQVAQIWLIGTGFLPATWNQTGRIWSCSKITATFTWSVSWTVRMVGMAAGIPSDNHVLSTAIPELRQKKLQPCNVDCLKTGFVQDLHLQVTNLLPRLI